MRKAIFVVVPMLFAAAFGLLAIEHANRALEADLAARQAHATALDDEVARLEVERGRLIAPARIEALARARGLVVTPPMAPSDGHRLAGAETGSD